MLFPKIDHGSYKAGGEDNGKDDDDDNDDDDNDNDDNTSLELDQGKI